MFRPKGVCDLLTGFQLSSGFSGPRNPSPGGGSIIGTLVLLNTSGSTQATNFITEIVGLNFKQAHILSGFYPLAKTSGGTTVPGIYWGFTFWPDGSIQHCNAIVGPVPSSIAGSGSLTLNIWNNGASAGSSSRSLGDVSGNTDLIARMVGFSNLSGTWDSSLNQGITDNDDVVTVAPGLWRVRQQFMQAAANHGQMECIHYIAALTDASNGIFGYYWMPLMIQPWMNVASPAPRAGDFSLLNSAASVQSYVGTPKTWSYSGVANRATCTGHGYEGGICAKLTTTGALPAGLTISIVVFVKIIDADTLEFWDNAQCSTDFGAQYTFSTSGSGVQSITQITGIDHHGAVLGATLGGECQFIAGTGTRSTVIAYQPVSYLTTTGIFPAWNTSITPTAAPSINYTMNTAGNMTRFVGQTGGRADIALMPEWSARHFYTQNATDRRIAQVNACAASNFFAWVFNDATFKVPTLNSNAATYTGMGTGSTTTRYITPLSANNSGVNNPSTAYYFFSALDNSHVPDIAIYHYLVFGAPWWLDQMIMAGNGALLQRETDSTGRNRVIGGTNYLGVSIGDVFQTRSDAWGSRLLLGAALFCPATAADGSGVRAYFQTCMQRTADYMVDFAATQSAAYRSSGCYAFEQNSEIAPWGQGYLSFVIGWAAGLANYTNMNGFRDHLANFYVAVQTNGGIGHINAYRRNNWTTSTSGIVVDDATGWVFQADPTTISTDLTTDIVTFNNLPAGMALTANDRLQVYDYTAIGGINSDVNYYLVNISGATAKLSATPSPGTPINITETTVNRGAYYRFQGLGTLDQGIFGSENYGGGYSGVHYAAMGQLLAGGSVVSSLSTAFAGIGTIMSHGTPNWADAVRNYVVSSYG